MKESNSLGYLCDLLFIITILILCDILGCSNGICKKIANAFTSDNKVIYVIKPSECR